MLNNIDRRSIVYLSGPITNADPQKQEDNKLSFFIAEDLLKLNGFNKIINPARFGDKGKSWHEMMIRCLEEMAHADVVIMLENWQESKGARIEHSYAQALGKKICRLILSELTAEIKESQKLEVGQSPRLQK